MRLSEQRVTLATVAAVALLSAACGATAASDGDGGEPAGAVAGMCAPDAPDCIDTVVVDDGAEDGGVWDDAMIDAARSEAEELLGVDEASLDGEVRVGRRGAEAMMLTEDYVLGRLTVELEPDDDGVQRVVRVIVELPDGPETVQE